MSLEDSTTRDELCWYCGTQKAQERTGYILRPSRTTSPGVVETLKVTISRCPKCRLIHQKASKYQNIALIVTPILALISGIITTIYFPFDPNDRFNIIQIIFISVMWFFFVWAWVYALSAIISRKYIVGAAKIHDQEHLDSHPTVINMRAAAWVFTFDPFSKKSYRQETVAEHS